MILRRSKRTKGIGVCLVGQPDFHACLGPVAVAAGKGSKRRTSIQRGRRMRRDGPERAAGPSVQDESNESGGATPCAVGSYADAFLCFARPPFVVENGEL